VAIHSAATGALLRELGTHLDRVYGIAWARDDSFLATASSDFTAKVWHLVGLPAAGSHPADGAEAEAASLVLPPPLVLQHSCFVYAVAAHPGSAHLPPGAVLTADFHGCLRLWDAYSGALLAALPGAHPTYINTLALDVHGSRLYSGDASGRVHEYAVDAAPPPGGAHLRQLRVNRQLAGEPISQLRLHPGGAKLLALTRRSALVSLDLRFFFIDRRFAGVRSAATAVKCCCSPDGAVVLSGSEEGRLLAWHADVGGDPVPLPAAAAAAVGGAAAAVSWNHSHHLVALAAQRPFAPITVLAHFAGGPQVVLPSPPPRTADGGGADGRPRSLQATVAAVSVASRIRSARAPELPDKLTPAHVRMMCAEMRSAAASRGLIAPQHGDGNLLAAFGDAGEHPDHLMVRSMGGLPPQLPAGPRSRTLRRLSQPQ